MDPEPPQEYRPPPAALQLELPAALPTHVARAALPLDRISLHDGARRRAAPVALAAVGLAIVGIVALEVLLPRFVRRQCIAEAAAHGIALSIQDVGINGAGFVLKGVKATSPDLPGASVEAPELVVETHNLKPEKLAGSGVEIAVTGRWSTFSAALARWRASDRGGQGGAWAPESLILDASRVYWRGPIGDQANVGAAGVHLDVAWTSGTPTIHATSSHVTVDVPGGTLGPWRVDVDRDAGSSRARIALDPAVPDGCTFLVVGNDKLVTSADVVIPRSPVARLGIAPALAGLQGDLQLEVAAHYAPFGAAASATVKGGLYGLVAQGISQPLDVAWEIKGAGPSGVIDLQNARVAVGPLVGAARGTLKTYDDGFRVDLAWNAAPVSCSAFAVPLAPGRPFDVAYQLRKLVPEGTTRRREEVSATATLMFDSRDLGSTTLNFTPRANCPTAVRF